MSLRKENVARYATIPGLAGIYVGTWGLIFHAGGIAFFIWVMGWAFILAGVYLEAIRND